MAETKKKTTTKKSTTKSSTQSSNKSSSSSSSSKSSSRRNSWGLNKISFYCIGAMAILYLIASILSLCGITLQIVAILQGFATAIALCIVAYIAWNYVRGRQTVWKVLYFVLLLVVLIGIILPLVV